MGKELFELIAKVDLSTPENIVKFKDWQYNDGTIEGLKILLREQYGGDNE